MNAVTSVGLRRARSRKHRRGLEDLVRAPQLIDLPAQRPDLLALLTGGQSGRRPSSASTRRTYLRSVSDGTPDRARDARSDGCARTPAARRDPTAQADTSSGGAHRWILDFPQDRSSRPRGLRQTRPGSKSCIAHRARGRPLSHHHKPATTLTAHPPRASCRIRARGGLRDMRKQRTSDYIALRDQNPVADGDLNGLRDPWTRRPARRLGPNPGTACPSGLRCDTPTRRGRRRVRGTSRAPLCTARARGPDRRATRRCSRCPRSGPRRRRSA
jgi:hypothetical protein